MASTRPSFGSSYLQILIGLVLIVGILYVGKTVIVPLVFAVLATFILTPVVSALQRCGLGRIPAALGAVGLAFVLFGALGWGVGIQIDQLARELPGNKDKIDKKIAELRGSADGPFAKLFEMYRELRAEPDKHRGMSKETATKDKQVVVVRQEESSGIEQLATAVVPVIEPLATAGLVVVLVVFMLIKREDLRNRLISLLGHGHLTGTTRVIVDAAQRLSRFLLIQLLVNIAFGSLFGVGLLLLEVPYALLWGFLTAVLRFVPYVGALFAVAFPLVLSFALASGWGQPVAVLAFFAVLELTTGNVIEPLLFGHSTGVTPVALLVAAAFWTAVWGPIGLVLSTPLTLCMVVLGQHVHRFKVFALLLGDEPALEPHASYYQRLLARDKGEAQEVVDQQVKTCGVEKVCDEVLLPALVLARRDRKRGGLTVEEESFIFETTKEILAHLDAQPPATPAIDEPAAGGAAPATQEVPPTVMILGCPAHDEAEELSLHMLAMLMKPDGCRIETVSTRALPSEVESRIADEKPALVLITIMPPGGLVQARYLCKRLRKRFKSVPLIVGYWSETSHFDQLLVRLRAAGASYVTTSILQTRRQILALVGPTGAAPAAKQCSLPEAAHA
jgi:predicted PurR-regulated permease PerM